jgi:hypothetical protein
LFPFGSINLGFLLRENLAAISIIPSSWGSQLDGEKITPPQASLTFFHMIRKKGFLFEDIMLRIKMMFGEDIS